MKINEEKIKDLSLADIQVLLDESHKQINNFSEGTDEKDYHLKMVQALSEAKADIVKELVDLDADDDDDDKEDTDATTADADDAAKQSPKSGSSKSKSAPAVQTPPVDPNLANPDGSTQKNPLDTAKDEAGKN